MESLQGLKDGTKLTKICNECAKSLLLLEDVQGLLIEFIPLTTL